MPYLRSSSVRGMILLLVLCAVATSIAGDDARPDQQAIITQLQPQQFLIGKWRGVGQVKRNSSQGAWQEKADGIWELTKDRTGIRWSATDGKLWKSALFTAKPGDQPVVLKVTLPDETVREYQGQREGERFVLESAADGKDEVHRATWTQLGDNRITVLFEKRGAKQTFYQRVAEVAYQREGTRLTAVEGNGPECVVTGGLGTMQVTHKGKMYYVCCTGCRDAFNDDPESILAAYVERKKKKAEASQK